MFAQLFEYIIKKFLPGYFFQARLIPSLLGFMAFYLQINIDLNSALHSLAQLTQGPVEAILFELFIHCSLSIGLVILLLPLSVSLGRHFIERIYFPKGEISMPTAYLLLENNGKMAPSIKQKIRQLFKREFDIRLLNEEKERSDPESQLRLIVEAVRQVRERTRSNNILLGKNIRYGALRNFLGAFCCSSTLMFILLIFSTLSPISLIMWLLETVFSVFAILLYKNAAEDYAVSLFTVFLSQNLQHEKKKKEKRTLSFG